MRSPIIFALVAAATACLSEEHEHEAATTSKDNISISVNADSLTRLPSQWADYFSTHYTGSPEGVGRWWNTVRSYGGTHTGVYATDDSPEYVEPLAGKPVRVGLSDFHSRLN